MKDEAKIVSRLGVEREVMYFGMLRFQSGKQESKAPEAI